MGRERDSGPPPASPTPLTAEEACPRAVDGVIPCMLCDELAVGERVLSIRYRGSVHAACLDLAEALGWPDAETVKAHPRGKAQPARPQGPEKKGPDKDGQFGLF